MKLNVTLALKNPGQEYIFGGEQAIAPMDVSGDLISFDNGVVKGSYFTLEDGSVTVSGELTAVAHGTCANCLQPAVYPIHTEFRETFIHGGDPEDTEIFAYESSEVDLDRLAADYALLNLPLRFLCRDDCEGYTAYLAADGHSVDSCQEEVPEQHPFAALLQLDLGDSAAKKDEEV